MIIGLGIDDAGNVTLASGDSLRLECRGTYPAVD